MRWPAIGCGVLVLLFPLRGVCAAEQAADTPPPASPAVHSPEQVTYEHEVRHAVRVLPYIKSLMWPNPWIDAAWRKQEPFPDEGNKILNTIARTLISIKAHERAVEVPEMHEVWLSVCGMMDRAEAAGLYKPDEEMAKIVAAVRVKKKLDAEYENAPWAVGPCNVVVDPAVEPIFIPKGLRFIANEERLALRQRMIEIRSHIPAEPGQRISPEIADHGLVEALVEPLDRSWRASVVVHSLGRIAMEEALPYAEVALSALKTRLNPISNNIMAAARGGYFSADEVRWLIEPKRDRETESYRWAFTDGAIGKPLGIVFSHMKLGRTRQVFVATSQLSVVEMFSRGDVRPEGTTPEDYQPATYLNTFLEQIEPLIASLRFVPGERLIDAAPGDALNPIKLQALIAGPPSRVERAVDRMIKEHERKSNFWLFLKDNPGKLALLLSALGVAARAYQTKRNPKPNATPPPSE